MQIRLRPSGGRGEYELAGSQGKIKGSELYGLALECDFGIDLRVPLYATADVHDGKPRIRLDGPRENSHAAKVIAAMLLLPQPIREIRETGGTTLSVDIERCAFSAIGVDVVGRTLHSVALRPRAILAINGLGASRSLDVLSRFELVKRLWSDPLLGPAELSDALAAHQAAAFRVPFDHRLLIAAAKAVLEAQGASAYLDASTVIHIPADEVEMDPPPLMEDDPADPIDVNRELRRRLAWRAERGADGRRFKQQVGAAYQHRCAFTGANLPPLGKGYRPGVDASHIYPWSRNGSNDVTNGISLSKQMHWAFDEGILRLTHDPVASVYVVDMPSDIPVLAKASGFDLDVYSAVCGPIPPFNLPSHLAQRPNPIAISLYNQLMFPML